MPRRTLHRQELLAAARDAGFKEKALVKLVKNQEKAYKQAKQLVDDIEVIIAQHKLTADHAPVGYLQELGKAADKMTVAQLMLFKVQLWHAEAMVASRDAQLALKEATIRDLRARVPKRNRA